MPLSTVAARRLALTEDTSNQLQNTLEARIQSASRFLLDQIAIDTRGINIADHGEMARLNQVLTG